jgi:hypothetical protein
LLKNVFKRTPKASMVALATVTLAMISIGSAKADVFFYNVNIPTDSLNANSGNGPFSILATLTDGSGTGDGNNTVTLTNFNVSGPPSTISLTDSSFLASTPLEPFTTNASPGSMLNFTLSTTNNPDVGASSQDEFALFIYDNTPNPVPTTDPFSSLFLIDFGGESPSVLTFQGTGAYEGLNATLTPEAAPAPEPSTSVTLAIALTGLAGLIVLRKRDKAGN